MRRETWESNSTALLGLREFWKGEGGILGLLLRFASLCIHTINSGSGREAGKGQTGSDVVLLI